KLQKISAEEKEKSGRAKALDHELRWIRMNKEARNEMSRARLGEYEKLLAQESAHAQDDKSVIQVAPGPELGDQVIEFKHVNKKYGDAVLFNDVSFAVPKAAIVGIIGPNGVGKTTLM